MTFMTDLQLLARRTTIPGRGAFFLAEHTILKARSTGKVARLVLLYGSPDVGIAGVALCVSTARCV